MKGIFIDLDGTLLNDKGKISKDDLEYIRSINKNYKIYISTGKSYILAKKYYDQLQLDSWLITSHGSVISKPKDLIFEKNIIDKKFAEDALKFDNVVIESENGIYYKGKFGSNLNINIKEIKIENMDDIIGIYIKTDKEIKIDLNIYKWDVSNDLTVNILRPKGTGKEWALKKIIERDNINEVIFIGNGRSDINSMLLSNTSIAMRNSHDDVLKIASFITDKDNNNSGVSIALKKIIK